MPNNTVEIHTPEGPMSAVEYTAGGPTAASSGAEGLSGPNDEASATSGNIVQSGTKGAVFVVQEAFGLTDHIADVCRRFADEGYTAIAPAFFHRQGSPVISYDDLPGALEYVNQLTPEAIRDDINATLGYLEQQGFEDENIAVVGFCIGGVLSFYAGTLRPLGAAVTFYGSIRPSRSGLPPLLESVATMKSPWIGFYGDQDHGIPVDDVEELKVATKSAPVSTEINRYADAGHGFHCDARPNNYNANAAKDAWAKTIGWLHAHVKPPQ